VKDGGAVAFIMMGYFKLTIWSTLISIVSDSLTALKLLKNDKGLCEFVKASYENNLKIDLFTKHNGYDIMKMINEVLHPKKPVGHIDSDLDTDNPNPNLQGRFLLEVEDPDDEQVESKFKAKQDVSYPSFNPDTLWNQCKLVLGIRMSVKGSKKGDGRKVVNETLSKVVKERWDKKKEYEKKRSLNKGTVPLGCGPHG
ncbi:hypothetical protein Tco_1073214, partial [Tanacetum coccineum]